MIQQTHATNSKVSKIPTHLNCETRNKNVGLSAPPIIPIECFDCSVQSSIINIILVAIIDAAIRTSPIIRKSLKYFLFIILPFPFKIHHIHKLFSTFKNGMIIIINKKIFYSVRLNKPTLFVKWNSKQTFSGTDIHYFAMVMFK